MTGIGGNLFNFNLFFSSLSISYSFFRFQYCLKKLRSFNLRTTLSERIDTNLNLLHLARDFIHAATTYGKIIISEYYLPIEKKTIKPRDLPGVSKFFNISKEYFLLFLF